MVQSVSYMKKIVFILISLVILLNVTSPAEAHPGNTAADNCHYCRTNCDKWGVAWNERHCHGGSAPAPIVESAPAVQNTPVPTAVYVPPTSAPLRVATAMPTKIPTHIPTKIPTRIPTKIVIITPTAKPTKIVTPTVTKEQVISASPTMKAKPAQRAIDVQTENEKGFWYRFTHFFFGK